MLRRSLLLLALLTPGAFAQSPRDYQQLLEVLVNRGAPESHRALVTVGELPPDLDVPFPLPGAVQVIGATSRATGEGERHTTLFVRATPADLQALALALGGAGWREAGLTHGGFRPSHPSGPLYHIERGAELFIHPLRPGAPGSEILVDIRSGRNTAARLAPLTRAPGGPVLPVLHSPEGALVLPGGWPASRAAIAASASVQLPGSDAPALHDAYARQLREAGWSELSRQRDPAGAVISLWRVPAGSAWRLGVLAVSPAPDGAFEAALFRLAEGTHSQPPRPPAPTPPAGQR